MIREAERIRKRVAETYARAALALPGEDGVPAGVAARDAGYRPEDLSGLPPRAFAYSFGCGNPVGAFPPERGDRVVDLGCGAGLDLLLAARLAGQEGLAAGVDLALPMARIARLHAAASGVPGRIRIAAGMMESLPFRNGSADLVYANAAVNLSPEKERVFAEIARVLRPGGRAALADVAVEEMPGWLREVSGHYSPALAGAIGAVAFRRGLEEAGLEARIVENVPYGEERIAEMIRGETIPGAEEARKVLGELVTGRLTARAARDLSGGVSRILVEAVRPA